MFGEYIDSHNHMHALNWDEWELLGTTGMRAAVLSCGNPHLYREVWDEAPGYDDIMRFWEGPIEMVRDSRGAALHQNLLRGRHQLDDAGERLGKIVGGTPRLTRKPQRRRLRGDRPGPHAIFLPHVAAGRTGRLHGSPGGDSQRAQ